MDQGRFPSDGCVSRLNIAEAGPPGPRAPDHLRRSREAGFDHHLVKPVDFDFLVLLMSQNA